MEKGYSKFFICCKVSLNLLGNQEKVLKKLGENWLIFALESKLEKAAETLVLHLGPKFMCLVVHFDK